MTKLVVVLLSLNLAVSVLAFFGSQSHTAVLMKRVKHLAEDVELIEKRTCLDPRFCPGVLDGSQATTCKDRS